MFDMFAVAMVQQCGLRGVWRRAAGGLCEARSSSRLSSLTHALLACACCPAYSQYKVKDMAEAVSGEGCLGMRDGQARTSRQVDLATASHGIIRGCLGTPRVTLHSDQQQCGL